MRSQPGRLPMAATSTGLPLHEVHPGPIRPHAGELTYLPDLVSHVLDKISRLAIEAEKAADHDDDVEYIVQRAWIGAEDREADSDQLGADLGLEVREGENKIGLERLDLVHAEAGERANLRLLTSLRRPVRGPRHADHALPGPQCVADLHVLRGEADDALWIARLTLAVHGALSQSAGHASLDDPVHPRRHSGGTARPRATIPNLRPRSGRPITKRRAGAAPGTSGTAPSVASTPVPGSPP